MSYCRNDGDTSEVYLYWDTGGYICCCGCSLLDTRVPFKHQLWHNFVNWIGAWLNLCDILIYLLAFGFFRKCQLHWWYLTNISSRLKTYRVKESGQFNTLEEAYRHLMIHVAKGDKVPDYAFEYLQRDINRYGADTIVSQISENK
jgi:hypothetical protein